MNRKFKTAIDETYQKLRTNKVKRNWYLKQEHILYTRILANRFNISQAEALRRLIDICISLSEDFIHNEFRKVRIP